MEKKYDQDSKNLYVSKRDSSSGIGFALLLILGGTALLGFNMGWFPLEFKRIVLSWQMLLIVLGIWGIFKRNYIFGAALAVIGAIFLLPVISLHFPEFTGGRIIDMHIFWPVFLIFFGLAFLFKRNCKGKRGCRAEKSGKNFGSSAKYANDADYIKKDMMFNGSEHIVFSDNFEGGDINVGFGEIRIDLRKVTRMNPNNLLEVNGMFGSVKIFIPENCHINFVKDETMFGSIEDKRYSIDHNTNGDVSMMNLNLKCAVIFGSIEIRN